ncbi:MAG: hypothetical protein MUC49_18310 [Raineya sp.]|jgi:hypothetical protein|nr:hypothetical protein [Raineya sp.]
MLQDFIKFFEGNAWMNILFFVLAIVSIILAIIFYYKSLKDKKPVYTKRTFHVIDNNISTLKKIQIYYNEQLIKDLSITKVAFWNSGKEPIRKSDIATTDPIVISTNEEIVIYDFELVFYQNVNDVIIKQLDKNKISIEFDFLNHNDGFILNVYHNGISSNEIKIEGTIIGGKKVQNGITKYSLTNKINDAISLPIDTLKNHKNQFVKIIGKTIEILVIIPVLMIFIPLLIVESIIDFVHNNITNVPKEFNFNDMGENLKGE